MKHNAVLWDKLPDNRVKCNLCNHNCIMADGMFGVCGMRENQAGQLVTYAYGNVIANHVDPIEKKPFYHFLSGTSSYSVATIGCNFKCSFCQNFSISQQSAKEGNTEGYEMKPDEIVREAVRNGCKSIAYTYTEPTIFFEYAYETAKLAKSKGLYNAFVTNGYMSKEAIEIISPYLDAANVDLKFFNEAAYHNMCKASLKPVMESIRYMRRSGIWVEVTTLIIPGKNDSEKELRAMAAFLASVDPNMPWHLSRFHPDYKFTESIPTPIDTLQNAQKIGYDEGLKYVYLGNVRDGSDTICPGCGIMLVSRYGFSVMKMPDFTDKGKCLKCGTYVPGIWK